MWRYCNDGYPQSAASKGRIVFAPTAKPSERTAYLDMSVGLRHPEARIDEGHMVSVSWSNCRPQAALLLPAPKPIET